MNMAIRVHIYNKANRFAFRDYTFINFGNLSQLSLEIRQTNWSTIKLLLLGSRDQSQL